MYTNSKHQKTKTNEDFERLQSSYSRGYFELYKKYFTEKDKIKNALNFIKENIVDIDFMKAEYSRDKLNNYDIEVNFEIIEKLIEILKSDKIKVEVDYVEKV